METKDTIYYLRHHVAGRHIILDCLNEVEATVRSVVNRAYYEGFTWAQIAEVLGCTPQAAWARYGRLDRTGESAQDLAQGSETGHQDDSVGNEGERL